MLGVSLISFYQSNECFLSQKKKKKKKKRNSIEVFYYLYSFKASSQWRKVQDRLEVDERCSRLEKIDRLEIFQVTFYILINILTSVRLFSFVFFIYILMANLKQTHYYINEKRRNSVKALGNRDP